MKIRSIAISNIYSFPFRHQFSESDFITLNDAENLSINIGPNGAGKTNFLEVISKVFNGILFKKQTLNLDVLKAHNAGNATTLNQTIRPTENAVNIHLPLNKNSQEVIQKIAIEIILSEKDIENLNFVILNKPRLNSLAATYANSNLGINEVVQEFVSGESIKIEMTRLQDRRRQNNGPFIFQGTSKKEKFIFHFFLNFNLLQYLVEVGNREENLGWNNMSLTFTILNAVRKHQNLDLSYHISNTEQTMLNGLLNELSNASFKGESNNLPAIFRRILHTLAFFHKKELELSGSMKAMTLLQAHPLYTKLKHYLDKFLNIQFDFLYLPDSPPLSYYANLKNLNGEELRIDELSSGQMAILTFIFAILGDDLKDGFILIDEPEVHLHPQMQKIFSELINDSRNEQNTQVIYVTHSPYFINFQEANSINRFYKSNLATQIISPTINESDKSLFKILNITNASKIFFADKVVCVEGETDEYFFRSLMDEYIKKFNPAKKNTSIEFLKIDGKGAYNLWRDFLTKFKVENYYIGDYDNIKSLSVSAGILGEAINSHSKLVSEKDLLLENSADKYKLLQNIEEYISTKEPSLLDTISTHLTYWKSRKVDVLKAHEVLKLYSPDKIEMIVADIEASYLNNVFILKNGDLEKYLGISNRNKGINSIIEYCKNDIKTLLDINTTEANELRFIMGKILE